MIAESATTKGHRLGCAPLALQEREQAKLGQVITAFQRIEAGTYGLCTECGNEVPFERLEVFPETPTCTACSGA